MTFRRALLIATVLLSLVACGVENSLGGSLSEVFPLDVSRVEVAQNQEALQITYTRNRGVFLDVVARVSVSLAGDGDPLDGGVGTIELKPGTRILLGDDGGIGVRRCSVTNAPGGEPVRNLPRIERGDLVITEGGQIGEFTKGTFSLLFSRTGGDVGNGRTLTGSFSGVTIDAGFGELP